MNAELKGKLFGDDDHTGYVVIPFLLAVCVGSVYLEKPINLAKSFKNRVIGNKGKDNGCSEHTHNP